MRTITQLQHSAQALDIMERGLATVQPHLGFPGAGLRLARARHRIAQAQEELTAALAILDGPVIDAATDLADAA